MKKSSKLLILLILFFIVAAYAFLFEPTIAISRYFSKIAPNGIDQKHFRMMNLVIMLPFAAFFAFCGFMLAKKRGRNRALWTVLSLIFNVWAILALLLLPAENRLKMGPGTD